jgi:hypothetical protein
MNPELMYKLAADHRRELMAEAQTARLARRSSRTAHSRSVPVYASIRQAFAITWNALSAVGRSVRSPAQV